VDKATLIEIDRTIKERLQATHVAYCKYRVQIKLLNKTILK